MGFGNERPASVALGRGEGLKRSLDGLRGLPLGVLVERLGGEALRFRDERRLAGLVKLEGEDADGGDGEGRCHGREGNALALAGSLALAEIVVAAAGDGGDDAQQFGLALGLSLRTQIGGEGRGRHFPQNAAGVGYQARLQNGRNAFLGTACGQHANDALAPVELLEHLDFSSHPGAFLRFRRANDN